MIDFVGLYYLLSVQILAEIPPSAPFRALIEGGIFARFGFNFGIDVIHWLSDARNRAEGARKNEFYTVFHSKNPSNRAEGAKKVFALYSIPIPLQKYAQIAPKARKNDVLHRVP